MSNQIFLWVGFIIFVFLMLALDLGVFNKKAHDIKIKEALMWSCVWITLALLFNLGIYHWGGHELALQYLTGYLLEKSLSVDNLFVFLLIFKYFAVPTIYQHRVLLYGILFALILRALFIFTGVTLISKFHWIIYIFGGALVVSGIKMASEKNKDIHLEKNKILKLFRKCMPVTDSYVDGNFFVIKEGKRFATPLFLALLAIETSDIIFAIDSIPAILSISLDTFIIFTSNVFAILGLRALYFALAGVMKIFHYLHYGLSAILVFVGIKMLITDIYKISIGVALGVLAVILVVSIIMSVVWPEKSASYGKQLQ